MALKSYPAVALDLLGVGERVKVHLVGGAELLGNVVEAKPHLLRLDGEVDWMDDNGAHCSIEHLIAPYQIAAITVKVVEA